MAGGFQNPRHPPPAEVKLFMASEIQNVSKHPKHVNYRNYFAAILRIFFAHKKVLRSHKHHQIFLTFRVRSSPSEVDCKDKLVASLIRFKGFWSFGCSSRSFGCLASFLSCFGALRLVVGGVDRIAPHIVEVDAAHHSDGPNQWDLHAEH